MRILAYSNCPLDPTLGSGLTRLRFSAGLRARGHDVRVIEPAVCEFGPRLRFGKRFRLAWGARRHFERTLTQETFDVVEISGGEFGWLAMALRQRKRRPLLVHRSDGCELLAENWASRLARSRSRLVARAHLALDEAAFRNVDGVVSMSSADRDHLQAAGYLPAERLRVLRPGLDAAFLDLPKPGPRPPRLVFLASWLERKGVGEIVSAFSRLLVESASLECDLLGGGMEPPRLKALFPPEVRSRVHVVARLTRAEIVTHLCRASIFVLPTYYEGYGMATAEAMACGCAVVTTPTGLGADLIAGEDALGVPVRSPGALHAALHKLIHDPALRERLAVRGWARVQLHRWDDSVAALESAYEEWLASTSDIRG